MAASQQALILAEGLVRQQELIVLTALTRRGLTNPDIRDAHITATDFVTVPDKEPVEPVQDLVADARGLRSRCAEPDPTREIGRGGAARVRRWCLDQFSGDSVPELPRPGLLH